MQNLRSVWFKEDTFHLGPHSVLAQYLYNCNILCFIRSVSCGGHLEVHWLQKITSWSWTSTDYSFTTIHPLLHCQCLRWAIRNFWWVHAVWELPFVSFGAPDRRFRAELCDSRVSAADQSLVVPAGLWEASCLNVQRTTLKLKLSGLQTFVKVQEVLRQCCEAAVSRSVNFSWLLKSLIRFQTYGTTISFSETPGFAS